MHTKLQLRKKKNSRSAHSLGIYFPSAVMSPELITLNFVHLLSLVATGTLNTHSQGYNLNTHTCTGTQDIHTRIPTVALLVIVGICKTTNIHASLWKCEIIIVYSLKNEVNLYVLVKKEAQDLVK